MNASLILGRDLIGRPVVDLNTGEAVAEVRDIVFDPADGLLTGFTLNGRGPLSGRSQTVLPIAQVIGVGTGAVMVADADDLDESGDPNQITAASEANAEVTDDLVITESGHTLGTVRDVVILGGGKPRVVAFEISGGESGDGFMPVSSRGGVSASALIVPDDYETRLRQDLAGLSEQINELSQEKP